MKAGKKKTKQFNLTYTYFPKPLFRLIDMVSEPCLPSNAYFSWTPDYTAFFFGIMFVCLNIPNFVCVYEFSKNDFGVSASYSS